jgi:hypothetical protein
MIERPNVEVTGAARLYRAASVWTAGLGTDAPQKVGAGGTAMVMVLHW